MLAVVLAVALAGGGAVYILKFKKKKPDTKGSADLEDYFSGSGSGSVSVSAGSSFFSGSGSLPAHSVMLTEQTGQAVFPAGGADVRGQRVLHPRSAL